MSAEEGRELARLTDFLEREGDRTVEEVVLVLEKGLKPKGKPKPAKKLGVAVAPDCSEFVSRLNDARGKPEDFERILSELQTSKALKVGDVVAIANGFRSTSKKYKSRSAAVEDVRKAWHEWQRDASKVQRIGGIF